jgi:hypothetical protein
MDSVSSSLEESSSSPSSLPSSLKLPWVPSSSSPSLVGLKGHALRLEKMVLGRLLGLGHDLKLMFHDLAQDLRWLQFFELLLIDDGFHQVIGLPETLKDLVVDVQVCDVLHT